MTQPAAAPTFPWPAMWPATPPTIAPLMHPFAWAALENARPSRAVQIISRFMMVFSWGYVRINLGSEALFRPMRLASLTLSFSRHRDPRRRPNGFPNAHHFSHSVGSNLPAYAFPRPADRQNMRYPKRRLPSTCCRTFRKSRTIGPRYGRR
jgi:hypothetical protein